MEERAVRLLKILLSGKKVMNPWTSLDYIIQDGTPYVVGKRYYAEEEAEDILLGAEHVTLEYFLKWAKDVTDFELTQMEQGQ